MNSIYVAPEVINISRNDNIITGKVITIVINDMEVPVCEKSSITDVVALAKTIGATVKVDSNKLKFEGNDSENEKFRKSLAKELAIFMDCECKESDVTFDDSSLPDDIEVDGFEFEVI